MFVNAGEDKTIDANDHSLENTGLVKSGSQNKDV